MTRETKKQLAVAYYLIAFVLLVSVPFGFPLKFVLLFDDPVVRAVAVLLLLAFLPAAFMILMFGGVYTVLLWVVLVSIATATNIILWIAHQSAGGVAVAVVLSIGLAFCVGYVGKVAWRQNRSAITSLVVSLRDFFAWFTRGVVYSWVWLAVVMKGGMLRPIALFVLLCGIIGGLVQHFWPSKPTPMAPVLMVPQIEAKKGRGAQERQVQVQRRPTSSRPAPKATTTAREAPRSLSAVSAVSTAHSVPSATAAPARSAPPAADPPRPKFVWMKGVREATEIKLPTTDGAPAPDKKQ